MPAPSIGVRSRWAPGPDARVDWSHPLAAGLVLCCPEPGYDLAYGVPITPTNNPGHTSTPVGPGRTFTSGSSTYFAVPAAVQLQIGGSSAPCTVAAFHRRTADPGSGAGYSIVARDVSGTRCYTLDLFNNVAVADTIRFYINGGAAAIATTPWPATNEWAHAVGTWNGSNVTEIWVNGVRGATTTAAATPGSSTSVGWRIGARQFVGAEDYLTGEIGPVHIWRRALSANEIAQLYADPFCMLTR